MTSKPEPDAADERLLAAHDLALSALREITPAETVGDAAGYALEDDGVVSLRFENLLTGYPGWFWTVSIARVDEEEPTVLEVELLPGDDALLAPDWVPWAVRLAEYQAQQVILEAERAAAGVEDDESDEDDEDDIDESDDDEVDLDAHDSDDAGMHVHSGDIDGVDIDLVADEDDADDEDDSDEDEDDLDEDEGEDDLDDFDDEPAQDPTESERDDL